jgi:putative ATP-binding cassette transporter
MSTNEANLYRRLQELGIHFISVGHRPSIIAFHDLVLELQEGSRWRLVSAGDYQAETGNQC